MSVISKQENSMEKYIQNLCSALKMELLAVWLLAIVAVVLGEVGVIPNGVVAAHSQDEFYLNTAVIVLTIVGVPLAMRLFTLNITRGLRRMNNEDALTSYHVWSAVRMGILALTALLGIVVYYLLAHPTGAFCALIAMCVTLYCWPSTAKIEAYLATVNND